MEWMEDSYAVARETLGKHASIRKTRYDSKVKPKEFSPGEKVYYYYPRKFAGVSAKWKKVYTGPFKIVKRLNQLNYLIQKGRKGMNQVVHVDKLISCPIQSDVNEDAECDEILPEGWDQSSRIWLQLHDQPGKGDAASEVGEVNGHNMQLRPRERLRLPTRYRQ